MQIVIDEVDGAFYSDLVLSPAELLRIKKGEMLEGQVIFRRRKCYVGVRLQGIWDYEEEDDEREEN
jgi:hypothetical protein